MKAEIIAIGDEVLLGHVENTNGGWIARQLSVFGIMVERMTVIPDREQEILDTFRKAYQRSDVTLITGGLGPTHDDLTKALIARFFDLPIVFRSDILEDVKNVYKKRQLSFIETSREQAEFPEGAIPIRNIHGTAPGIWVEREGRIFVAMPGVPLEMRAMVENFVVPRLKKKLYGKVRCIRLFHTIGVREAFLADRLKVRGEIEQFASLAFLPSYESTKMRLTAEADSCENAEMKLDKAEKLLRQDLGTYIFGEGLDFSMEQGVGELLKREHWKLAVAESCTAGLLAKRITDVPGSTAWFERGFVTYSNEAKHELLGVPLELIEEHGAVSSRVARAMAEGALRNSHTQVALSITGIAGPDGGTKEKPVGLVYIGYADGRKTIHQKHYFGSDRKSNRLKSTTAALVLLVQQLGKLHDHADGQLI